MAFLEKFSAADKELLVSLPWRAGLWVSAADEAGHPAATAREIAALEAVINAKARHMPESALVHEVMAEIASRRADRDNWSKTLEDVPQSCEKAVAAILNHFPERDADAYRQSIMHIAVAVAKSFREFDVRASFVTKLAAAIRIGLDKLVGMATGELYESDALLNISFEEDLALARLAQALGIKQD